MVPAQKNTHNSLEIDERLTVAAHAKLQTLLQSTVLATIAVHPVDDTLFVTRTLVVYDGALRASEEAFAALARDDTIVDARRFIATYFARYDLDLSWMEKTKKNIYYVNIN